MDPTAKVLHVKLSAGSGDNFGQFKEGIAAYQKVFFLNFFLRLRGMGIGGGLHSEFVYHLKKKKKLPLKNAGGRQVQVVGFAPKPKHYFT